MPRSKLGVCEAVQSGKGRRRKEISLCVGKIEECARSRRWQVE